MRKIKLIHVGDRDNAPEAQSGVLTAEALEQAIKNLGNAENHCFVGFWAGLEPVSEPEKTARAKGEK